MEHTPFFFTGQKLFSNTHCMTCFTCNLLVIIYLLYFVLAYIIILRIDCHIKRGLKLGASGWVGKKWGATFGVFYLSGVPISAWSKVNNTPEIYQLDHPLQFYWFCLVGQQMSPIRQGFHAAPFSFPSSFTKFSMLPISLPLFAKSDKDQTLFLFPSPKRNNVFPCLDWNNFVTPNALWQ